MIYFVTRIYYYNIVMNYLYIVMNYLYVVMNYLYVVMLICCMLLLTCFTDHYPYDEHEFDSLALTFIENTPVGHAFKRFVKFDKTTHPPVLKVRVVKGHQR